MACRPAPWPVGMRVDQTTGRWVRKMGEAKAWCVAFGTNGAPAMLVDGAQASRWAGASRKAGKASAFDRIVDQLEDGDDAAQLLAVDSDHALFVDTDGGGSTLVCAAEDAAWIVVAVCTSEDGDTPKVKDLQRYVEKSAPKGKSRGTLTVSHGLVVTDSAIAGASLGKKGGTALVAMVESAAKNNVELRRIDRSGVEPGANSAFGAYVGAASGTYQIKVAEDVEIAENTYTVVRLARG